MTENRKANRARRAQRQRSLTLESLEERRVLDGLTIPLPPPGPAPALQVASATYASGEALAGTVLGPIDRIQVLFQLNYLDGKVTSVPSYPMILPADVSRGASNPLSATYLANWQLFAGNAEVNGAFSQISANAAGDTITLVLAQPLIAGSFRLVAHDAIEDIGEHTLDGDGNGTAGGDFSRSFTVSAAITQSPPQSVALPFTGGYPQMDLARNAQGAFVVVATASWLPNTLPTTHTPPGVVVQRFNAMGVPQGDPLIVDEDLTSGAASIAIDDAGNFVVSWSVSLPDGVAQIVARRYAADGTALGDKFAVSQSSVTGGHVMMDAAGNFAITWGYHGSLENSANGLYFRRYDSSGAALSEPQLIASATAGQLLSYDAAMNRDGSAAVTWTMEGGLLFVARFAADGQPIGTTLSVAEGTWAYDPHIAIDDAGDIVIVWQRDENSIMARRLSAAGDWLGYQFLVSDVPAVEKVDHAAVAMAPSGTFVVSWNIPYYFVPFVMSVGMPAPVGAHDTGLWAKAYDANGSVIDTAFRVEGIVPGSGSVVGLDAAGHLVVGWDGIGAAFCYRQYALATPLSVDLNGPASGIDNALDPQNTLTGVAIAPVAVIVAGDNAQLLSATITIIDQLTGDTLSADTTGTSLVATFVDGVLSLTGADSFEHYQQVLRSVRFTSTAQRTISSKISIAVVVADGASTSPVTHSVLTLYQPGSATVADQHLFYNRSKYDGNDAQADARDDQAIAVDKFALRPGDRGTFANYTSYARGINGLMIDLAGTHGTISADDFTFRVGNNNLPASWANAPPPLAVVTRPGAGVSGSDRVEIIWADGAIRNTWLEITVRANGDTGLAAPSVFYFGNAVGETGNTLDNARVNLVDVLRTFNHLHGPQETVGITDPYDFNRDGLLTIADAALVINQAILRLDGQHPDLASIQPPRPNLGPIVSITLSPPDASPPYAINLSMVASTTLTDSPPPKPRDPFSTNAASAALDDASTVDAAMAQWEMAQWEAPDVLTWHCDEQAADGPAEL